MKILIIEDEYPAAERLEKLIRKTEPDVQVLAILESIRQAHAWFPNAPDTDLIFSDIQLSDGLSFQIFEAYPVHSPIIFTTSYDEYAIKAFKVRSVDYLLKPVKAQELEQAIGKFKKLRQTFSAPDYALKIEALVDSLQTTGKKSKTRFLVKSQEQLIPVPHEQVAYFYTANELVCLVRQDGKKFLIDYTLEELEKIIDPARFFRLNRQYIANLSAIDRIHAYFNGKLKLELSPQTPQEVIVSREKAQPFKEWMEG